MQGILSKPFLKYGGSRLRDLLVPSAGSVLYLPGMPGYGATTLDYSGNTVVSDNSKQLDANEYSKTNTTSYIPSGLTLTVANNLNGARIKFDLKMGAASFAAYGKLYKNGIAFGTEQTDVTGGYVTKSEDFTNLLAGDVITVWVKAAFVTETEWVRNLSICYDYSLNNGAITGATWKRLPSGLWVLSFPGAANYIEVTAPAMNFTTGDFSILMWVKITSLAENRHLCIRGLYETDGYLFSCLSTGQIVFFTHQLAAHQTSSTDVGTILINNPYLIGMSRAGASVKIYVNGVDRTTTSGNHTNPTTSARTVKIGIYDDKVSEPMSGLMGLVNGLGHSLIAAEHATIFAQERSLFGV